MTALTQRKSGRLALVAIMMTAIAALTLIALRPADATGGRVTRVHGNACSANGYEGYKFSFNVPLNDHDDDEKNDKKDDEREDVAWGDQGRVFDKTFDLEDGATLRVVIPSNRKSMSFWANDASVSGVFVFNRYDQRLGRQYNYSPPVTEASGLTAWQGKSIKRLTFCYNTKAQPSISTSATPYAGIGEDISDTAVLTGGNAPHGDVVFTLYAADSCGSGEGVFSATEPVSLNEDTDQYEATATYEGNSLGIGMYYWVAAFQGDNRNYEVSGTCGDDGESTEIFEIGLGCDETASEEGGEGDIATSAIVVRGEPTSDDGTKFDCEGTLPATLEITSTEVQLLFPEEFEGANLIIKIDWANEDGGPDNLVVGTVREVDTDDDGTYEAGQGCASSDLGPGELPIVDDSPSTPLTVATHPTGVPICLVAQILNGYQTQYWSIKIDPQWR